MIGTLAVRISTLFAHALLTTQQQAGDSLELEGDVATHIVSQCYIFHIYIDNVYGCSAIYLLY
jgi:hypothetical protein